LLQIAVFAALVLAAVKPYGGYIAANVNGGGRVQRGFARLENGLYRLAGIDATEEQGWTEYALAIVTFHVVGIAALYGLLRLQDVLPLNPQQFAPMSPDLALNTAVSFATNTSWQSYGGESTLGYLAQMAGLVVQSFTSAATGIAVALALVRGFARSSSATIGNFWVDLTRITLYVLLPVCIVGTVLLVWQGVPQTFAPYVTATTLEGQPQVVALGPVATQKVVAVLSGDGGGFFNANSAHPFENPTGLTSLVQMLLIFLVGAALTNTFGRMVGDQRHGWALLAAMSVLFGAGLLAVYAAEAHLNPCWRSSASIPPAATWRARKPASASSSRRCSPPRRPLRRMERSTRCMTASCRCPAW
jgi:K+-transporting ATPase ATPase A chain